MNIKVQLISLEQRVRKLNLYVMVLAVTAILLGLRLIAWMQQDENREVGSAIWERAAE
jgi:hypothetical protein